MSEVGRLLSVARHRLTGASWLGRNGRSDLFRYTICSGAAILLFSCSSHRFISHLTSVQQFELPFTLQFIIPEKDKKNPVDAVFCERRDLGNSRSYEISVVFKDEDHPFFLADWCYDIYRRMKYKRKMDVETFSVLCGMNDSVIALDLKGVYSGPQDFNQGIVKHGDMLYLDMESDIQVFVNTRNHLFSLKDNNPGMKKTTVSSNIVYIGSREEVEKLFGK
jgi:hypothetical protein